jgi:hypothetical protein
LFPPTSTGEQEGESGGVDLQIKQCV